MLAALATNTSLERLTLGPSFDDKFVIGGMAAAKALAEALPHNKTLQELHISGVDFGGAEGLALVFGAFGGTSSGGGGGGGGSTDLRMGDAAPPPAASSSSSAQAPPGLSIELESYRGSVSAAGAAALGRSLQSADSRLESLKVRSTYGGVRRGSPEDRRDSNFELGFHIGQGLVSAADATRLTHLDLSCHAIGDAGA